jgi:hypothetical protein
MDVAHPRSLQFGHQGRQRVERSCTYEGDEL